MMKLHKKTIYETLSRGPVHPFPARMAPGIALELVAESERPLRVLDPMMGSGTVLAIARSKGHYAIGVDIDPLAVLIARVWTTAVDPIELSEKAIGVLRRAKVIFKELAVRDAYPINADDETKQFALYWFDSYARRQLAALSSAIRGVRSEAIRNAMWCAFSRLIITKQAGASLAMDVSHSRPHRVFDRAPVKPFSKFLSAVNIVSTNCVNKSEQGRGPAPRLFLGDARALPIEDASIDLILTSPPYLNAIDYIRCSKFSLMWMGYSIKELRKIRAASVGAENGQGEEGIDSSIESIIRALRLKPKLPRSNEAILRRFIADMLASIGETARILRPGGQAVYVVGENAIRGTYVRNATIVSAAAEFAGLRLTDRRARTLPANRRYLPPPLGQDGVSSLNARMRREVILAFRHQTN